MIRKDKLHMINETSKKWRVDEKKNWRKSWWVEEMKEGLMRGWIEGRVMRGWIEGRVDERKKWWEVRDCHMIGIGTRGSDWWFTSLPWHSTGRRCQGRDVCVASRCKVSNAEDNWCMTSTNTVMWCGTCSQRHWMLIGHVYWRLYTHTHTHCK